MSEIYQEKAESEMQECPSQFIFRWDSKGGWLVVPLPLLLRVDSAVGSVNSHIDDDDENVYLDEKKDANEFARGLQRLYGLQSEVPAALTNFRTLKGVQIVDICEGAVSSIRRYRVFRRRVSR